MNQRIKAKCSVLPEQPGCYLMKDRRGTIIYVGKAKILKRRVSSYFTRTHDRKTAQLVKQIADFTYILTASNVDALILEMNLIKKYRPKYNILLKDDKSYPFIKITAERHPRLIMTHEIKKDKGIYFGPFPNVHAAYQTKRLLDRLYPLRKCLLNTKRPCLDYQIGQCIGCCARSVSESEYRRVIRQIMDFFNGGFKNSKRELTEKMDQAAKEMNFESAKKYRDLISAIEATMEKQSINTMDFADRDVFGYAIQNGWMCVQVFFIRHGKMLEGRRSIFPVSEKPETELLAYLERFYQPNCHTKPREVLLPETVSGHAVQKILQTHCIQPKRGQKKKIVALATKNARVQLQNKRSLAP
ncbi:excinuclease ABC subunit C [Terrilactibacillus sp. BCM23-1]|uniref:Excinuclease ABC subunit C n=1 Tax=Terrilactibacillus tamarindi TaxID=2599694 RepID=A0A6N8CN68_9BACI|nr:excinuclease ABC subunit UvrC [Terrilactibacillus tamarindi]MTT31381.1 excinuclease ABC subunit C [Terrilactibacillus tamarindi]